MTITMHRCQCNELSSGLCAACELSLRAELHELADKDYEARRADWEQQNPPSVSEVWPR